MIWSQYDKDGHGYLDRLEAKHFVDKYFKMTQERKYVDETLFGEWFRSLDADGDGKVSIVNLAT
jgi:Ca2+-binding EF-hand superfamily protein